MSRHSPHIPARPVGTPARADDDALQATARRLAGRPGFCWLEQNGRQLLAADPVARWVAPPGAVGHDWLRPALAARQACGGLLLGLLPYPDGPDVPNGPCGARFRAGAHVPGNAANPAGIPAVVHLYRQWFEQVPGDPRPVYRQAAAALPTALAGDPAGLAAAQLTAGKNPLDITHGRFRLLAPFLAALAFDDPHAPIDYRRAFDRIQAWLAAGDIYQANLAVRFDAPCAGNPFEAHLALRASHHAPWAGYFALGGDDAVLCHSPEAFLSCENGQVTTRPIKGTRPRGDTPANDLALAQALASSTKDRAENLMIVDLLRNDLGRVCRTGSVQVQALFQVESHTHVHHLVSTVRGHLRSGCDLADLLDAGFPGGSITGAPKSRAREVIASVENRPRQVYCGSLFSVDGNDRLTSNITIRTLLAAGDRLSCWGGGGIVADSDCAAEFAEIHSKVDPLMRICESFLS